MRFKFETALGFRRSDNFEVGDGDDYDWTRTDLRKFEAIRSGDSFGMISFGQGSMTTDGAANADVSGTSVVATPNPTDPAGKFQFRTEAGGLYGIEIDDAFSDFDGPRQFRIRYDTPEINGFSVGAAYGEEILDSDNDDTFMTSRCCMT
ncbi:MAG: hypothetical protein AAF636_10440 [Pseudomonadota bacterium]